MRQLQYFKKVIIILLACLGLLFSCNKNSFLNKKPSSDLVVPSTLNDFQALLDNDVVIQETPELGEVSADDIYLSSSAWTGPYITAKEQNAYIWSANIYNGQGGVEDWDDPYQQVFYANIVLEGLPKIPVDSNNVQLWKFVQGSAYFIRAYAFYNLAQLFAPVYTSATISEPGIFLRENSAIEQTSIRANVQQTYDTILADLHAAASLLSKDRDISHLNRPSKPAVLAMLARVYLSMQNYDSADFYATSCLKFDGTLLDYNSRRSAPHFDMANPEILYQSHLLRNSGIFGGRFYPTQIDSGLYQSYADSDLRKAFFYTPGGKLNDTYSTTVHPFSGLAVDEVYLIRAECSARENDTVQAINDVNNLLLNRFVTNFFMPYSTNTPAVLDIVLEERRKELALRGLRWTDLRRLNALEANITLRRYLFGTVDTLGPTDQRYVLPVPPDVPH